jgi:hypothetical protein
MTDFNDYKDTDTLRYSNLTFLNGASIPQLAKVTETRTSTLLQKPSDWKMSVIRFDVDSQALPINLPLMQNFPDSNTTQSIITLRYLGIDYSQVVNYVPSSINPIYNFPTIYNYQDWLDMVNQALALAFLSSPITTDIKTSAVPVFIFDAVTGLINLYVDGNFTPTYTYPTVIPLVPSITPALMTIYMNRQLFTYFTNFEYLYQNINATDPLLQYELYIDGNNARVMPAIGSRQNLPLVVQGSTASSYYLNLYRITDTAPSTANWSSVRSLILSSGGLPFRAETVPNISGTNNYNSDNDFPILSDFLVPVENAVTNFRVVNEYLPTAQYRYLDLLSDTPLTKIDLIFSWTDFTGTIYPLYLLPQESFSVKLLFERRDKKKY